MTREQLVEQYRAELADVLAGVGRLRLRYQMAGNRERDLPSGPSVLADIAHALVLDNRGDLYLSNSYNYARRLLVGAVSASIKDQAGWDGSLNPKYEMRRALRKLLDNDV